MRTVFLALLLASPCVAGDPLIWTKSDGTKITGEWIDGDENSVTVLVQVKIPLGDLNEQAKKQAETFSLMMAVVNKAESRLTDIGELHRKFEVLYSERGGKPTPTWRDRQQALLKEVERKIENNGSTVDACFIQLAKATKAAGNDNDKRVAKSLAKIVLILLGSKQGQGDEQ